MTIDDAILALTIDKITGEAGECYRPLRENRVRYILSWSSMIRYASTI